VIQRDILCWQLIRITLYWTPNTTWYDNYSLFDRFLIYVMFVPLVLFPILFYDVCCISLLLNFAVLAVEWCDWSYLCGVAAPSAQTWNRSGVRGGSCRWEDKSDHRRGRRGDPRGGCRRGPSPGRDRYHQLRTGKYVAARHDIHAQRLVWAWVRCRQRGRRGGAVRGRVLGRRGVWAAEQQPLREQQHQRRQQQLWVQLRPARAPHLG
jgi:hypothetical protein